MNRNYSIDIIKFVFSIVILLYHFRLLFLGGYLAVEGFFMISGFLMMNTVSRQSNTELSKNDSTALFVLKKYAAIFLPLLFSAVCGFVIYEFLVFDHSLWTAVKKLPYLLFEVFPLQVAGFGAYHTTGVTWYLSALFLGLAIIHPFAKRDPERFAFTVCPPAVLLIYGFLCYRGADLDMPCTWLSDFVNSGLLRGIAGLCAGCILYVFVKRAENKQGGSVLSRVGFSVLSLIGWAYFFLSITKDGWVRSANDYIATAILFGVLFLELSGKTFLSVILRHKWVGVLSTISSYVFMNHYAWAQYFVAHYPDTSWHQTLPWYLLCVAASSAAVMLATFVTRLVIRKIKKAV